MWLENMTNCNQVKLISDKLNIAQVPFCSVLNREKNTQLSQNLNFSSKKSNLFFISFKKCSKNIQILNTVLENFHPPKFPVNRYKGTQVSKIKIKYI